MSETNEHDEVEDAVEEAKASEESETETASEAKDEKAEPEPKKKSSGSGKGKGKAKTRVRRVRKSSKEDDDSQSESGDDDKQMTMQDLETKDLLPKELPKPAEKVKTLGDLIAKYDIGENPDFKLQVWRTFPKMFPGGVKADGFYDTWDQPLSHEEIQKEYGGGTYRIVVVGPHPTRPNIPKHYDSVALQLAGEPKHQRVPRSMQGAQEKSDEQTGQQPQTQFPVPQENPQMAKLAVDVLSKSLHEERAERRRYEDQISKGNQGSGDLHKSLIDAERSRSEALIESERKRAEWERQTMQERLEEERRRADRDREQLERKIEESTRNQRSFGDELKSLKEAGFFNNRDEGAAQQMFNSVLEKHRSEMDALQQQHTRFVESLREGHREEIKSLREAHARELAAEREASRSREQRTEERLEAERNERRRDQERFRETINERDQQWRDRMEQQQQTLNSSWEARHQALTSTYENRIEWLQGEVDRLKSELNDAKQKQQDQADPITQLHRLSEMKSAYGEIFKDQQQSQSSGSSGSTGFGLSGGDDWKSTLAEGVSERLPQLLGGLLQGFGAGGAPAAQGQQQPQEGQEIETPNGTMVVVRGPNGQLGMAPKAAVEQAKQQAIREQQGLLSGQQQGGGGQEQQHQPRVMDPRQQRRRTQRGGERRTSIEATPNLADGLPRPKPPWEGGTPTQQAAERTEQREEASDPEPQQVQMNKQEKHAVAHLAKSVHESVSEGDEPDEFIAKLEANYPQEILVHVVSNYSVDQIVHAIAQLEPRSLGATPAGVSFVRASFRALKEKLRNG